jgi:diguanylate cyclase (GGDEF)-like protein/PAS domain S-box-containing protein
MDEVRLRLQLALDAAQMLTWDATVPGGNVVEGTISWSAGGAALLGLPPVERTQSFRDFLGFVHPDDRASMLATMQNRVDQCGDYLVEYRLVRPDGRTIWVATRARTVCEAGIPVRTIGVVWNDTERKLQEEALHEQKELAEVTLSSIGDGVVATNERGMVRFLNRVAERLTGCTSAQAQGLPVERVLNLADAETGLVIESPSRKSLRQRRAVGAARCAMLQTPEGQSIPVEASAAPIWSNDGKIVGTVAVIRDVSDERRLAQQSAWQATHDPLTGLMNRREFERAVAGALHNARTERHRHALLYMDLDRFKIVNDSCGHAAGDMLLQTLAHVLLRHVRESDTLARLGGDELGVLLACCPLPRALARADEIRQAIKDFRFVWGARTFELGVSIGLVEIDEDSKSVTELLVAADQACHLAKEQGRNRIQVYRESDLMLARRHGEMDWIARLHEAFALDRFRLFAQPIVPLADIGAAHHHEVLLRLSAGDRMILPGAFLPAAERYDMMGSVDRWVVTHLCRYIGERPAGAVDAAREYAVNLAGTSLNDSNLLDHIIAQFDRYGVDPARICFEITETAVIANLPKAQEFMARLRTLGCRFSLDDFGSGLSSFAYLRALPVDYLKIDGVFIRGLAGNPINRALVKAINEVGHVMGMRTIAEYVEDEPTLAAVRELGVDFAQGYAVGALDQLALG